MTWELKVKYKSKKYFKQQGVKWNTWNFEGFSKPQIKHLFHLTPDY